MADTFSARDVEAGAVAEVDVAELFEQLEVAVHRADVGAGDSPVHAVGDVLGGHQAVGG